MTIVFVVGQKGELMSDMTNAAAIDLLDNLVLMMFEDDYESDYDTALRMAIDALKTQADTDTVSRQAALDAVCEELDSIDHVPQWVFDRLTKKIENLPPSPSRPQESQWIPVSERLPELDVNINVYTKENPIMVSEPVCISYRLDGRDYVCPIPCILHSNGHWYIDNNSLEDWVNLDDYDSGIEDPLRLQVTAWMPNPEPYKGVDA